MAAQSTGLAEFLRARREIMQPEDVGIPRDSRRRVPGLRREEIAQLAGISADYYLRLEQGRDHQPSEQVLSALARALRLDHAARVYLQRLAHPSPIPRPSTPARRPVDGGVLGLVEHWSHIPAYITDANHDLLYVTAPAAAMAPGYLEVGTNLMVSMFAAAPGAHSRLDWERSATSLVSAMRFHGDPSDPRLREIVGDLSVSSRDFRRMWASHDARPQTSGTAPAHVDPLGWVEFRWQTLDVPGAAGQFLTTFFGDPGSTAAAAIAYLAARAAGAVKGPAAMAMAQDTPAPQPAASSASRASAARDSSSLGRHTTSVSS